MPLRFLALALSALCLVACINTGSRSCSTADSCTAYTGIGWTDAQVRDNCSRMSATFAASACAASPYGTCVLLEGGVTEARVFTYTAGATEALVESGCCAGGGSNATWISASGARRPCGTGGGTDEGI